MNSASGPVLSIGETLIDIIATDGASSLAAARNFVALAGGAPANVAVALARLGVPSAFCGVVGADPLGERLIAELQAERVDVSRLRQTNAAATTIAFAWKDERGDGRFWILRGADLELSAEDADHAGVSSLMALVLGSVSLAAPTSRAAVLHAVALANRDNVPVVFDVNLRPSVWSDPQEAIGLCESVASRSTIVKLSLDDAAGLYGAGVSGEDACARILALGAPTVVLTDGSRGCWFANATSDDVHFVPAYPVDAIEPTGAGDAFAAGIIARAIASGWAPLQREDVQFASAAGALATTKRGAWDGLPTPEQLEAFLAS
ncbi:MAG: carbohydrate kinase [Chloroflexota bacterium]|nr:carbohydrate kinase [Chloroflexota bacterium]